MGDEMGCSAAFLFLTGAGAVLGLKRNEKGSGCQKVQKNNVRKQGVGPLDAHRAHCLPVTG